MTLTDNEVRHLAIDLLTAPTERDRQTRIGASNLGNQCDYCLAAAFKGVSRGTPMTDRAWLGRTIGTAMSLLFEQRAAGRDDLLPEHHVWFAEIAGYGKVGGSIDLLIPGERSLIDWKGTTRQKLLVLIDFIQIQRGLKPLYGRTHAEVKLSERKYAEEMEKMRFKVDGYYAQQQLYMRSGVADRASLFFYTRGGTGWWDNPGLDHYETEGKVHDTFVLSFDYDADYADALVARGQRIWDRLSEGADLEEFDRHEMCFPCSIDARDKEQNAIVDIFEGKEAA